MSSIESILNYSVAECSITLARFLQLAQTWCIVETVELKKTSRPHWPKERR